MHSFYSSIRSSLNPEPPARRSGSKRMPETPGSLRQRPTAKKRGSSPGSPGPRQEDDDSAVNKALTKAKTEAAKVKESTIGHSIAMTVITILAFVTRFWKLSHPNQVVFDEVHFGKVCCVIIFLNISIIIIIPTACPHSLVGLKGLTLTFVILSFALVRLIRMSSHTCS